MKLLQKYVFTLLLGLHALSFVYGQNSFFLSVKQPYVNSNQELLNLSYDDQFASAAARQEQLQTLLLQLYESGYLTASFDSLITNKDTLTALLNSGPLFQWAQLEAGNIDEALLSEIGWREQLFSKRPFKPKAFRSLVEKVLQFCENNGYPFATLELADVNIEDTHISAQLNLKKNQEIVIDDITVVGQANISKKYLYNYLGVRPKDTYNESRIRNIDQRINELPFLKVTRPLNIYFTGNKARIVLYLDNRKASQVDGIIGVAPNNSIDGDLLITGELQLKLQNLLGSGKSIDMQYRSFLAGSQDLKIKLLYPYLFNTSIGIDYQFNLLRFDTSYIALDNNIGLQYFTLGTDYFKFFYNTQSTSLLTVDTISIKISQSLPQFSDLRNTLYGLGMRKSSLDYAPNPRKGFTLEASVGIGRKRILRNSTINDIRFENSEGEAYSLYDSLDLRSTQYRIEVAGDLYKPIGKRSAFHLGINSASLVAENIFVNELFRIGGFKTLKGFDEQSIWASSYGIVNLEYRYLLQKNSNFILFWNGAYYEDTSNRNMGSDFPFGFGAGANFEVGAGIFSIFYALGKQQNSAIEFRTAKIHFGLVSYF